MARAARVSARRRRGPSSEIADPRDNHEQVHHPREVIVREPLIERHADRGAEQRPGDAQQDGRGESGLAGGVPHETDDRERGDLGDQDERLIYMAGLHAINSDTPRELCKRPVLDRGGRDNRTELST